MNSSSSATQPPASNVSGKPAPPRFRSKTLTAALAFLFGSIGAHRFYLYGMRDKYGWAHIVGIVLGAFGYHAARRDASALRCSAGCSRFPAPFRCWRRFSSAIVYGLRPDAKWDAQFNAHTGRTAAPAGRSSSS